MLIKFILSKFKKDFTKLFAIIFSVFLIVTTSFIFLVLYKNIENIFVERQIGKTQENQFEIIYDSWLLWQDQEKKQEFIEDMNNLKNQKDFEKFYRFYSLEQPIKIRGWIMDLNIETNWFVFAVDDQYFLDNNININQEYIPIGVSQMAVDFYNMQIASSTSFPKLHSGLLTSLDISILFGKSDFYEAEEINQKTGRPQTIDQIFPVAGITIPYSVAEEYAEYNPRQQISFYRVVWETKNQAKLYNIQDEFREKYNVTLHHQQEQELQNRLSFLQNFFIGINWILIIIFMFFMIYIIYFLINSNKNLFYVLRLHWATRINILNFILLESFFYVTIGIALSVIAYWVIELWLLDYIWFFINENYFLEVNLNWLEYKDLGFIIWWYIIFFMLLTIIFSYKEWSRKYIN